ncbi:MAG: amidohydrolase/deacetylase family metallohydrolase [Chloroflexi bacterium]|nr:amidohydrolase/deacetylase family metallohydrolase [Chloroflexota bacterium]
MTTTAERFDLVLKGGRVLDPGQDRDGRFDLGIRDGRIARVAPDLPDSAAIRVIDVTGKLVTPGLIDLHTHVAGALRKAVGEDSYVEPDLAGVNSGITTVVDAGSVGAYSFGGFLRYVVPNAKTRVISFINAGNVGLLQQPEVRDRSFLDVDSTAATIRAYPGLIKGVKFRMVSPAIVELGIELPKTAKRMAVEGGVRVMVHVGDILKDDPVGAELAPRLLSEVLTAGDIVTHTTSHRIGALLGKDGKLLPQAREARQKGVIFDVGHGMANFTFKSARSVLDQGFVPDTLSSDLTERGRRGPLKSLTEVMGKFLALGLSLSDVVRMVTVNPARAIGMESEIGALAEGRTADISVLDIVGGDWIFRDNFGGTLQGRTAIAPVIAVRAGVPMPLDHGPHPWGWLPERAK